MIKVALNLFALIVFTLPMASILILGAYIINPWLAFLVFMFIAKTIVVLCQFLTQQQNHVGG